MKHVLDDVDISGKILLIRYDLNVSFKGEKIVDDSRLREACASMRKILATDGTAARLVLLAHLGRPKGKVVAEMSLERVRGYLADLLEKPVEFCPDPLAPEAKQQLDTLPAGGIVLVENLRFWPGEEANDTAFSQQIARLGDVYVNEAFSACHRAHASTHGVARHLSAYAGPNLAQEINALERCLDNPGRPNLAIIGGAKISTKIGIIEHLIPKLDHLIIGGAMANTFLHAKARPMGQSLFEPDATDLVTRIMALADKHRCQVHLPEDVIVASGLEAGDTAKNVSADDVPEKGIILDAGIQSVQRFCAIVDQCRTVLWNGPLGAFEYPPFDAATRQLAQHVAAQTRTGRCLSVAGGGDTLAALRQAEADQGFSHVSSAGGAFLEWLRGDTLPGIAILQGQNMSG